MNIHISITQEAPRKIKPEYCQPSIQEKIDQYILDINSNLVDSYEQWQYLKYVYSVLSKKAKLSAAEKDILRALEPEVVRHMEYDATDAADLDGTRMHRYLDDEEDK